MILRWQYAPNPSPNGRRVDAVAFLGVIIEGGQAISECGWLDPGFVIRECFCLVVTVEKPNENIMDSNTDYDRYDCFGLAGLVKDGCVSAADLLEAAIERASDRDRLRLRFSDEFLPSRPLKLDFLRWRP
jgi:hypothetical protein